MCLKVLRIFGKLRPCHDQVNIMVIICTTSGDMIPMENGLNYHALEPWNLLPYLKLNQKPGVGGTQIFGRTRMCRSNGSLFYKKSLNMGPIFYQKILKHGSTFLTEPKFLGFRLAKTLKIANFLKNGQAKTLKIAKFLKNGPIFQEKSLKMGTFFCQNHP